MTSPILPSQSVAFRSWVLDRLDDVIYVWADGVTARCPICHNERLAVVFAGTEAAVDLRCLSGCPEEQVWDAMRARP